VLYETGELEQAQPVLTEGAKAAAAAGAAALRARIGVLLSEIHILQGGSLAEALEECQAATAVLESESDLEARAEGWLVTGRVRFWVGDLAAGESLERAIGYARQSGNHRALMQASFGLAVTFHQLPIPADAAVRRVEELLQGASGEQPAEAHLLMPLSLLYAYAGRFADARAAIARCQSLLTASGARLALARSAEPAGYIELAAGDPAAAEHCWREGYDAFRAMGARGQGSTVASHLAEALYAQERLGEAQQMTEQAQAAGAPDDIETQARWRATRAKLLARRGQFPAALRLVAEAEALIPPASLARLTAHLQMAKAEVYRIAGASDQATASLHAALRIYQDRHAAPLAEQAKAALTSLARTAGP
jgi:hypothetical protein